LIAALCADGPTLWLYERAADPAPPPLSQLRPPVGERRAGRITPSVARPPTADDLESVQAEVSAPLPLHVYPLDALRDRRMRTVIPTPALVVTEGVGDLRPVRRRCPGVPLVTLPGEGPVT
jgi:hypothetical protein